MTEVFFWQKLNELSEGGDLLSGISEHYPNARPLFTGKPFPPLRSCIPDFRPDGNRSFETDGPLHLPDRRQE